MTLADFQLSYNGITIGAGTAYRVLALTGLRDLPAVRSTDLAKVAHPGDYSGLDTLAGLSITAQIAVVAASAAAFETAMAGLVTATAILATGTLPLAFKLPSMAASHYQARPRKRAIPILPTYNKFWAQLNVEWYAPDPTLLAGES